MSPLPPRPNPGKRKLPISHPLRVLLRVFASEFTRRGRRALPAGLRHSLARAMAKTKQPGVNRLVRKHLARLVEEPNRRRLARARLRKAFETGLVEAGGAKWSRDELYDR